MADIHFSFLNNSAYANSPTIIPGQFYTAEQRPTSHQGCIEVQFSANESSVRDNPTAIVSSKVETIANQFKTIVLVVLFLIGGPGNVINMVVFYKQDLKDRVNLCLFALALSDGLYLAMGVIYNAEQLVLQFTDGNNEGPLKVFLTNNYFVGLMGFGYISYVLSAIIAIERCHCVLNPLSYQNLMSTRTMAAIIVLIYILMTGLYFMAVGFRFRYECTYDPTSGVVKMVAAVGNYYKANQKFLDFLNGVVFGIGLPVLVITVVTATTIITAVKLGQILTWRAKVSVTISAGEVALTKMLIGVSILFIICVFPTALIRSASFFLPDMNVGRRYHNFFLTNVWISQAFTFVNSSFNIFVYYTMGSRYRQTFKSLFTRQVNVRHHL